MPFTTTRTFKFLPACPPSPLRTNKGHKLHVSTMSVTQHNLQNVHRMVSMQVIQLQVWEMILLMIFSAGSDAAMAQPRTHLDGKNPEHFLTAPVSRARSTSTTFSDKLTFPDDPT